MFQHVNWTDDKLEISNLVCGNWKLSADWATVNHLYWLSHQGDLHSRVEGLPGRSMVIPTLLTDIAITSLWTKQRNSRNKDSGRPNCLNSSGKEGTQFGRFPFNSSQLQLHKLCTWLWSCSQVVVLLAVRGRNYNEAQLYVPFWNFRQDILARAHCWTWINSNCYSM